MKFQRLSAKLEYNNETLLNDLQHKISSDLQRVTINEWIRRHLHASQRSIDEIECSINSQDINYLSRSLYC